MSGIPGPGAYQRAQPIFRPSERIFDPFASLRSWRVDGGAVHLVVETRSGSVAHARVSFASAHTVRLQWCDSRPPVPHLTEMLTGPPPELEPVVSESDGALRVSAGGPELIVRVRPWQVMFGPYRTEPGDTSLIEWVAEPSGVADDGGQARVYDTFALEPGEELYGLGERFLGPGLRGRRLSHWIDEPYGTNTTDLVYKSVPLVISSRGYGVFYHHPEEATFDLGAGSTSTASVLVEATSMDLFIMLGEPKEVLGEYTALTGRSSVPPEWSFGVWMSRCMYVDRPQLEEVIATSRQLGCPVDVINIDPLWLKNRNQWGVDACDFVVDEAHFGPIAELADWLHSEGIRLCLWVNPHVMEGSPAWRPQRLVEDGAVRERVDPRRAFVDFTGEGRRWWLQELRRLVDAGVDCIKLDYGEVLPMTARMADGRTGAEVHNLYPMLASMVAHEAEVPVVFTRAGTAGSQRYPLHWAGDSQSTWAGMAGALRGGLAASWSGFAHWTSDIGGFYRRDLWQQQDAQTHGFEQVGSELYIRWLQMGMLCSHTRFHGMQPREPWAFGELAVATYKRFAALRRDLRPYLLECSREAAASGCPLMRPLALEFPQDRGARGVDTEFMLGPALLVCPVLGPGGRADLYVPPGGWTEHFTGQRFDGPGWVSGIEVPLDRLPLLVRDGYSPFPPPV